MDFSKTLSLSLSIFFPCLLSLSRAYTFYVGGKDGWVLNPSESYDNWTNRNRFRVNDILVFNYARGSDSVAVVGKEDYDKCDLNNPIVKLEDGKSEFKFDRSGTFYFASGKQRMCENGQKLAVVVMSQRSFSLSSELASSPLEISPTSLLSSSETLGPPLPSSDTLGSPLPSSEILGSPLPSSQTLAQEEPRASGVTPDQEEDEPPSSEEPPSSQAPDSETPYSEASGSESPMSETPGSEEQSSGTPGSYYGASSSSETPGSYYGASSSSGSYTSSSPSTGYLTPISPSVSPYSPTTPNTSPEISPSSQSPNSSSPAPKSSTSPESSPPSPSSSSEPTTSPPAPAAESFAIALSPSMNLLGSITVVLSMVINDKMIMNFT